ncbi:ribosomal protein l16a [Ceraceosorus bombacis]|uniref:Ribosomal protein l16a n=1 Tax=Ceraceosorus bombacis TaxID=401625 RepID=A0A0P1BQU4_9BASI|nr:ribosomal protein l16a [Ceraceosorus bombacis]
MASFSNKPVVVDAKGHLLGRLASTLAKQALSGQKVVVVRCEEINVSGSFFRNKLKYVLRLKQGRKFATIKRLSSEFGWKYADVIDKLEAKRKVKGQAYHARKVALTKKKASAATNAGEALKPVNEKLAVYGL